jgi:hypothetical protein
MKDIYILIFSKYENKINKERLYSMKASSKTGQPARSPAGHQTKK